MIIFSKENSLSKLRLSAIPVISVDTESVSAIRKTFVNSLLFISITGKFPVSAEENSAAL